jgi:hypothetical protein
LFLDLNALRLGSLERGNEVDTVVKSYVGGNEGVGKKPEEHEDTKDDSSPVEAAFLFGPMLDGGARGILNLLFLAILLLHLVESILLVVVVVDGEGDEGDEPEELWNCVRSGEERGRKSEGGALTQ